MTITVTKNSLVIFQHEILSFSVSERITAMLSGGYAEHGMSKGTLYEVSLNDGTGTIEKTAIFDSYQYQVQTYTKTVDGTVQTVQGITNNSLQFSVIE